MKAFGRIEKNPDLTIRDRSLTVVIPVAAIPGGYKSLEIWLQTMHLPDYPGATMISRGPMPKNLGEIVEKALGDKLPKLVET